MGMYFYHTIDLHLRPEATKVVEVVLLKMIEERLFKNDEEARAWISDLERITGDSKTLDHPFFHQERWSDIFLNWTGEKSAEEWENENPCRILTNNHLLVRASFKEGYPYEQFVEWITPFLDLTKDQTVWYISEYDERDWDTGSVRRKYLLQLKGQP